MDNDALLSTLIAALGVRPIRIPGLPQRIILLTRYSLALIDANATHHDWEALYDAVLTALPQLIE